MEYIVVLLIFVVFLQTRIMDIKRAVYCLSAQSGIVAGACLYIGLAAGHDLHAILVSSLTFLVKVVFIPGAILRVACSIKNEREILSDINVNYSTLAAAVFLVLGYLLVDHLLPTARHGNIIAVSLLMIMTGLSLMVMRKRAILQLVGLITLENGIYLLGLPITEGLPLVVELGVFLDVLIAVVVLVILTNRMQLSFMTTDTTVMRKLKG